MSEIQNVSSSAAQSDATVGAPTNHSFKGFANLDLTEAQRAKIRSIFTAAKQAGTSGADVQSQVKAVLTPAQLEPPTFTTQPEQPGAFTTQPELPTPLASTTPPKAAQSTLEKAAGPELPGTPPVFTTSPNSPLPDTVTNVQNQAVAAQSTLLENLQRQILASNGDNDLG